MALTAAERRILTELRAKVEHADKPAWTTRMVVLGESPELAVRPERLLTLRHAAWILIASFASWEAQGARRFAVVVLDNKSGGVVVTLLGNERTLPAAVRRATEFITLAGSDSARRSALRILRKETQ